MILIKRDFSEYLDLSCVVDKVFLYVKPDGTNIVKVVYDEEIPDDFKLLGYSIPIDNKVYTLDNKETTFNNLNQVDKSEKIVYIDPLNDFYKKELFTKKKSIWTKIKNWFKHNI